MTPAEHSHCPALPSSPLYLAWVRGTGDTGNVARETFGGEAKTIEESCPNAILVTDSYSTQCHQQWL